MTGLYNLLNTNISTVSYPYHAHVCQGQTDGLMLLIIFIQMYIFQLWTCPKCYGNRYPWVIGTQVPAHPSLNGSQQSHCLKFIVSNVLIKDTALSNCSYFSSTLTSCKNIFWIPIKEVWRNNSYTGSCLTNGYQISDFYVMKNRAFRKVIFFLGWKPPPKNREQIQHIFWRKKRSIK